MDKTIDFPFKMFIGTPSKILFYVQHHLKSALHINRIFQLDSSKAQSEFELIYTI